MFINNYEFYDYRGVYMTLIDYLIFLKNFFVDSIFPRFLEMVFVTIQKKETLEILIPLMITLFLVQLYFGRNKDEQIGWNTAYANCIVLLFVIAHLGTYVYEKYGSGNTIASNFLRFDTQIRFPEVFGNKTFIVRDRMNARYGNARGDFWMPERQLAVDFGVQRVKMEVYYK